MKRLTILILAANALLASCMSTRKAVDYLSDEKQLARVCADSFPVREKVDTIYREDTTISNAVRDYYQSVIDEMDARAEAQRDSLLKLAGDSVAYVNLYELYAKESKAHARTIMDCANKLAECRGKVVYVERVKVDSAALRAAMDGWQKTAAELGDTKQELREKSDAAKRWRKVALFSLISNGVALFLFGFMIRRKMA